jgi:hypothetical protein
MGSEHSIRSGVLAILPAIRCRPHLPPGARQGDCDRPADPLEDFTAVELWNACNFAQQEVLAARFVAEQGDLLRDALLDDRVASRAHGRAHLGGIIHSAWIGFRDLRLREMLESGQIEPPGPL